MKTRRQYGVDFKMGVVESLLSGTASLAQVCRQHNLASSIVVKWKQRYKAGTLVEGPARQDTALQARIAELERMVGRLAMENDFLKKAAAHMDEQRRRATFPITAKTLAASSERAK